MKNIYNSTRSSKEDIRTIQVLVHSWSYILKNCLKISPVDATNCDQIYWNFERQKEILQFQERQYLAPLGSSVKNKSEQIDKIFAPLFASPPNPIEKVDVEKSENLEKEIRKDQDKIVKTKIKFELSRNEALRRTVDPNYPLAQFTLGPPRCLTNKEINTSLKIDLNHSDETLRCLKTAMLRP